MFARETYLRYDEVPTTVSLLGNRLMHQAMCSRRRQIMENTYDVTVFRFRA
jgi:hypothetical protein